MNEPYESIPDGEPHAVADWITRILAGLLLALHVDVWAYPGRRGVRLVAITVSGEKP